jgi:protein-disulfide isomerase
MSDGSRQRIWFAIGMLVFVIAGSLYVLQPWNSSSTELSPSLTDNEPNNNGTDLILVSGFETASLGDPNAPVIIEEYSDFQCSICRRYVTTIKDQVTEAFVDTGQVYVVFHNFIRYGDESILAAQAAECAGEQDKFWEYHRTLYDEQRGINRGSFTAESIVDFAERLGLDSGVFQTCVDSGKYVAQIEAETAHGRELGIRSTPGFVINGKLVGNISSLDGFQQLINQALQESAE